MSVSSGCSEAISSLMSSTVVWVTVFSSSGSDSLLSADIKEETHVPLSCGGIIPSCLMHHLPHYVSWSMDDVTLVSLVIFDPCPSCESTSSTFLIHNILRSFVISVYGKFLIREIDAIRPNFVKHC